METKTQDFLLRVFKKKMMNMEDVLMNLETQKILNYFSLDMKKEDHYDFNWILIYYFS